MITRRNVLFGSLGGATLILAGCETVALDGTRSILDVMGSVPELSNMRAAIRRAGLEEMLAGAGPFTVFAPSNAAWAQAPQGVRDGNADAIRGLIARGRLRTPDMAARRDQGIRMMSGVEIRLVGGTPELPRFQVAPGGVPLGASSSITRANLLASNGIVHVITGILLPAA